MFVVDVAFFQYLHNMFVVVVTYSLPALGLTLLTWTKSERGVTTTNILFSHFTGDAIVERN
jgi:hypothetical protein